jgi:hypothetical protein
MRHVITLSTIPPRFAQIGPTLASLVRQTSRPEAVELYIPASYRRFPEWGGGLPEVPEGVTIVRVEADHGPATKVLPAARKWRGQGVDLLYADDDHHYARNWARRFLDVRREHPEAAVCAAATTVERMGRPWSAPRPTPTARIAPGYQEQIGFHLRRLGRAFVDGIVPARPGRVKLLPKFRKLDASGFVDIAEGYAGVALRPEMLDDAAFDIPPVIWSVDDVWLSGHFARRGVPIWADQRLNLAQAILPLSRTAPLYSAVIEGSNRPQANTACVDYMRKTYGIWGGTAAQST